MTSTTLSLSDLSQLTADYLRQEVEVRISNVTRNLQRAEEGTFDLVESGRSLVGTPGMLMYVASTRPVGPLNCVVKLHGCPAGATFSRGNVKVIDCDGFHPPCEVGPDAAHGGPTHVSTSPVATEPEP